MIWQMSRIEPMKSRLRNWGYLLSMTVLGFCAVNQNGRSLLPTTDDGRYFVLSKADLPTDVPQHLQHESYFGQYVHGINRAILKGIDVVQAHAMDGGGYFTGKDSIPTESPVYYNLHLFSHPLIAVPRHSSYCSGATYAAFIEALNVLLADQSSRLSPERLEALRLEEPDGGRREDLVKFWGYWNADGFGNHFALVQYSQMGTALKPAQLRPGDFVNISWKSGLGHSVIFLAWVVDNGERKMLYWSSQRSTNGYGDQLVSLERIKEIKAVRLSRIQNLFTFDINQPVSLDVPGDIIDW